MISVIALNLSCTGEAETLLGSGICLYFWHFFCFLIVIIMVATHIPGVTHLCFLFVTALRCAVLQLLEQVVAALGIGK